MTKKKNKIPKWMSDEHWQMKLQWIAAGRPTDFYCWLVDRIENKLKKDLCF